MSLDFGPVETLALAALVLHLGSFVLARVRFLRENDIPVPVVGGLLFALATSVLFTQLDLNLSFDMSLKDPVMLAFFASLGLAADLRLLAQGGRRLLVFAGVCMVYLVVQDVLGVLAAVSLDLDPLVGLLSASITLSGGHGTGAAYAQRFSEVQNLAGSMELAMACATFGLIIGGLLGGPVAGRLIRRHRLVATADSETPIAAAPGATDEAPIGADTILQTLLYLCLCLIGGQLLSELFAGATITLPSFVWCLLLGVVVRNALEWSAPLRVHRATVETLGSLSLSLFLAMALMSLRLWELLGLAGPLVVMLAVQTLALAAFATFVTFRFMGKDYDAAIIAGGHCGFGMGATPTAVANMQALTRRFGPSPQAFLVVPLMGAFFIDLLNALVIQGFLSLPRVGL